VEHSANVCVAHGTRRNDPSVYPTFCNKTVNRTVVANFVPGNFGLFGWNPWQPLAEHWFKNTCLASSILVPKKYSYRCPI